MYVVTNKRGEIVGYHINEEVVFEYTLKYNKYSEKDEATFKYVKDKKFNKYLKEHKNDANKYLLRFNSTFVPEMYIDSESLMSDIGFIKEVQYSRDILDTVMSCYDELNDKQMKQLGKAYQILNCIITDMECYTPDIDRLNYNKNHIEELTHKNEWDLYGLREY